MNETQVKSCKVPLLTFNSGQNKFYDSTFSIPIPFAPNKHGAYNVEINEVIFANDEDTLIAGKDYLEYRVYYNRLSACSVVRYNVAQNVKTTKDAHNYKKINGILNLNNAYLSEPVYSYYENGAYVDAAHKTTLKAELKTIAVDDKSGGTFKTSWSTIDEKSGRNPDYRVQVITATAFPTPTDGVIFTKDDIIKITLKASNNFLYLFGDLFDEKELLVKPDYFVPEGFAADNGKRYFEMFNLRYCGPIQYVLDTNLNAVSKTVNENGQIYNVVAQTRNLAEFHNSLQQMNSTMTGTVKDMTNFRVRLLNDFFEPVKIYSPISINLTVSNSD